MKHLVVFLLMILVGGCQAVKTPITVIAHRGASGYLPEHTLASAVLAHGFDVDYVEADLVMSKDNVLVVMHDHSLNTSTDVAQKFPNRKRSDGAYYVIDFTLAELKSLTVHERRQDNMKDMVFPDRFPSIDTISDFRIPTFEEFILTVQGLNKSRNKDIGIAPEMKEPSFHAREGKDMIKATVDLLTKYGYNTPQSKAMLQAFSLDAIKKAKEIGWEGDLVYLTCSAGGELLTDDVAEHLALMSPEGITEIAKYANWYSPWLGELYTAENNSLTVKPLVDNIHQSGMKIVTWTHRTDSLVAPFKSSEEMFDFLGQKVKITALFSDQPDVLVEYNRSIK